MQKVYLLLRNNQQTGPFNLDELLQFDLKPFDLIWIEGKSAGWYYPQEIEALRPHLPFLKKVPQTTEATVQNIVSKTETSAPKKIFVSMPSAKVARETTQQTAFQSRPAFEQKAPTPASPVQRETSDVKTTYSKPLEEVEKDYMNWAYQKKTKKKPVFSKSGVIVLCVLGVALFATWKFANKPVSEETESFPQQNIADAPPVLLKPENNPVEKKLASQKPVTSVAKKEKGAKSVTAIKNTGGIASRSVKNNATEVTSNKSTRENEIEQATPAVKEESSKVASEEKTEPVATEKPKEKKKFGDKILDIFRKKPSEKTEEAKPVETDNGARQSTRREAGSSLTQLVAVKFDVPNSWMMGIKGAKATLTNRSSETLAKAVVEVRYYNDDDDLLDKKNIVFTNIKSKQSGTVSVPEHATATRLEYSVISAVGNEPVARL